MKKYKKYIGLEADFQTSCAIYLDSLDILWFHCPNEIKAKPHYLAKRRRQGVKSGVPDICILEPNKLYNGLFIELKVGYNKASDNQNKWLLELQKRGYKTLLTHSFDEFIDVVDDYFKKDVEK